MWTIERREVRDLARRPAHDMPRQLLVRPPRRRIAEPRDTVAREQLLNSRQGLLLVRMKRDVAETNVRRRRAEHRARDAGPDASQCLFGALFGAHGLACEPGEKGLDVGPFQAVRVETRLEQVDSTFPSAVWTAENL